MNPLFTIELKNGGLFYSLFYFLAFLTGLIILIMEGRKRKFPTVPWLLVIATSFLFFIVGTQIVKFSASDWQRVLQFKELQATAGRSVLGGILLVVPGIFLAKYLLRFRYSVMDAFAMAIPVGMAVQRFGCLLAGCCYGTPTTVPWGIHYGSNSLAYHQHLEGNLIPAYSTQSLLIHPIALYEILGCLIAIVLLYHIRKFITVSGNLFLTSLGLYLLIRFITEFFRAITLGNKLQDGLTLVQLVILIVLQVIIFLILLRERKFKGRMPAVEKTVSDKYALIYFLGLAFLFSIVSKWMTQLEIVAFNLVMLPTLFFIGWYLFKSITVPTMRLNTVLMMIGSLMLMSQTFSKRVAPDSTQYSYTVIGLGVSTTKSNFEFKDFYTQIQTVTSTDCNGNPITTTGPVQLSAKHEIQESASISGAGFMRVDNKRDDKILQYGVDAYWGSIKETSDGIEIEDIPVFGVRPFFQHDWKLMGFGLGLHMGNLGNFRAPESNSQSVNSSFILKKMNAFPSAYFRIGYLNKVFGEVKVGQQFPSPFPGLTFQTSVGFGLKGSYGGAFRIGTASHAGLVLSPTIPLGQSFMLEPQVGAFPAIFADGLPDWAMDQDQATQKSSFTGSVSLRYKFGRNVGRDMRIK
jgi:phosphatidylglycerol:prolipoprotein diacylglycerol transferase